MKDRLIQLSLVLATGALLLSGCSTVQPRCTAVEDNPTHHYQIGMKALEDGNITVAQEKFERALYCDEDFSTRDDEAAFSQEAILFYGEAVGNPDHRTPAQREQMAKRAAVVTAQRALVEYLEGFALVGDTLVKDGMAQYDVIRSAVSGFVKGSQVVFQGFSNDKAIAMIKLGLHGPKGFASAIYEKMSSDSKFKEALKTDKKPFKAQAVKLDEAYDGLIIDATEQGCGEYTNSIDKAKAALATRGVKNPLVIKASGATTVADLQVTDEDAVMIYSANQKGSFMAAAKVAFVLK